MIITTALANEIVARAMAIIHHNVNVIDHHGQIIASGERHRIGEQHEVAREVIRTGKRICINNAAEAARFHNVHPGINHPIIYDDRVVMVVGISGDPAAISRYAELAVLTAELLVRQAIEMRENFREMAMLCLFRVLEDSYMVNFFINNVRQLLEHDSGEVLLDTLSSFIANNAEPGKTSLLLGIHRNTLTYRLQQIKKHIQLDPMVFTDLTQLAVSVHCYRRLNPRQSEWIDSLS